MDRVIKNYEDVDSWKTVMFLYQSALKEVGTKLEILNDEFQHVHQYNPIEHIKTRVKTAESIVKKLKRYGYETSIENMVKYINDIAGVRVVCSFPEDIYLLADCLLRQDDIRLVEKKDYIQKPKESGYRSLHLIVAVPIFLQNEKREMKVEVQLRTIAMDFWASLEHKVRYKKNVPPEEAEQLAQELSECAEVSAALDRRMQDIRNHLAAVTEAQTNTKKREPLRLTGPLGLHAIRQKNDF